MECLSVIYFFIETLRHHIIKEIILTLTIKMYKNTDIEMGRLITGAINPVVLYVSGGNTQVWF